MSAYLETEERLRIRIHAHTAYADVRMQDWLLRWLGECDAARLLEMGCGTGNYFPTYAQALGREGLIIGLDRQRALLHKAREAARTLGTPSVLLAWDFDDHPYPLLDEDVDMLVAPFSAYYADDVHAWVDDGLRVLRPGGRVLLLGPTSENASELHDLNEAVTGIRTVPETDQASRRLEAAFLPELRRRLGSRVHWEIFEPRIVFPSAEEFARYYCATWLYEKTAERLGEPVAFETVVNAAKETSLRLTKQVICIQAAKD
ncbi:MAG: methyltransferase domain-containing protein [Phycisphaerae bacterium]|nr:methyltransferase domain-containing protein [Phycisphaerae bacterium]